MLVYKPRRLKGFDGKKGEKKTKKQENQLAQELAAETNPYRIAKRGFQHFSGFYPSWKFHSAKTKVWSGLKSTVFFHKPVWWFIYFPH